MNVGSGKALAQSLGNAQAVYFSAGSLPMEQYVHFGLAAPIYMRFTSPIRCYADVMVHRLLAAAVVADSTFPTMLKGDLVTKIANNLNYRYKQAQYAGRASVLLNTILYFKGRTELHDGFIMGIRKNGIQVAVMPTQRLAVSMGDLHCSNAVLYDVNDYSSRGWYLKAAQLAPGSGPAGVACGFCAMNQR